MQTDHIVVTASNIVSLSAYRLGVRVDCRIKSFG